MIEISDFRNPIANRTGKSQQQQQQKGESGTVLLCLFMGLLQYVCLWFATDITCCWDVAVMKQKHSTGDGGEEETRDKEQHPGPCCGCGV